MKKKKIKDLTLRECKDICDKRNDCEKCSLNNCVCENRSFIFYLFEDYEEELENEVEVDE